MTRLDDLIRGVAFKSQDFTPFTAENETPSASTIVDSTAFLEDNDYFLGSEVYMISGANAGLTRRVYGSDLQTMTLTVFPEFPNPVVAGDQGEIYNRRGNGHRRVEYKGAINSAIRQIRESAAQPAEEILVPLFDQLEPFITTTLDWVCRVQYEDYDGEFKDIRPAPRQWAQGWFATRVDKTIAIGGEWVPYINGRVVRLIGYRFPNVLVNDSDTTPIDYEWLLEIVAGSMQTSNPDNYGNIGPGQWLSSRGDAVRAKAVTLPAANCRRTS